MIQKLFLKNLVSNAWLTVPKDPISHCPFAGALFKIVWTNLPKLTPKNQT